MLAKMIDKIVSLKETKTFEIGGQTYTDGHLTRIPPHVDRPEAISVSGLDGVCKLIRTELEKVDTTIMVQAKSYKSVEVMTTSCRTSPATSSTAPRPTLRACTPASVAARSL